MYSNLSNFAEGVDNAFVVILSIIFFFLIGLTGLLIYFIVRYREKKSPKATHIEGNTTLEIIWTVIPLVLVLAMFYFGWTGWKPMFSKAPEDAIKVTTTARMWSWSFEYENGRRTDTLYIPHGEPVVLDLKSVDVIHSLYIPAFRLKQDMVPGKEGTMWFIANSPGSYDLFCTEYCGLRHSYMFTSVEVMEKEQFNKWYTDTTQVAAAATPAEGASAASVGRRLTQQLGCNACHSIDGSVIVGPSFQGLYGKQETVIVNGEEQTVTADDDYIRRSIYDPNAEIVEGYNSGLMQSYEDQLTEEDVNQIIEYLKTLSE
jgi:cytochrome c oxidase subunit 2